MITATATATRRAHVQHDDAAPEPLTADQAADLAERLAPWLVEDVTAGQMRVRTYRRTRTRRGTHWTVTATLRDWPGGCTDPRHD